MATPTMTKAYGSWTGAAAPIPTMALYLLWLYLLWLNLLGHLGTLAVGRPRCRRDAAHHLGPRLRQLPSQGRGAALRLRLRGRRRQGRAAGAPNDGRQGARVPLVPRARGGHGPLLGLAQRRRLHLRRHRAG
eukprot:scaffold30048_cov38-Phaeocystis_antarctica.AAC.3